MEDEMSLIYNINLCRICQIPGQADLISTLHIAENGNTHLDTLKFIFNDIVWIEDDLLSLVCKACVDRIGESAAFKRQCIETNRRRTTVNLNFVKLEYIEAVKIESVPDLGGMAVNENGGPQVAPQLHQRPKRKASVLCDDASEIDYANKRKRKKTLTRIKVLKAKKTRGRPKKASIKITSDSENDNSIQLDMGIGIDDDDNENIENNAIDQNVVTDNKEGESKEIIKKMSQYLPQYKPSDNERKCRICKRKFSTLKKLEEHIRNNHLKLRRYRCDICHMGFIGRDALNRHVYKHNGTRNYICTICGRKYITQGDLTHHLERHADVLKYACDICPDKKFKTYSSLRTHRIIVHTDPKDFKYLCTECGSKFPSSGGLKVHMFRHKNVRNFTCHMCDKSFCTKSEMQRHTATHSNMRPFKCDMCPSEYKHKNILLIHKTKRHGIGNYKFRTEKKFECSYCEKKIASKDKLERHIRTHTGVKPYKCRLCDQKFICKSYIKGHIRGKHDINVEAIDYDTKLYYEVCEDILQEAVMKTDVIDVVKNDVNKE